jgi:vitamin B12 transporter
MEGVEAMFSYDLGAHMGGNFQLSPYAGLTYMLNTRMENEFSDTDGNTFQKKQDMLYVRKATGNMGISFDNRRNISARINGRYIGTRLEQDMFTEQRPMITPDNYYTRGDWEATDKILQHPHYVVLDASAYYTFKYNIRLGLSVSNLLDENFTEKDGFNMPGRQFIGSLSFRL